jgi:hypothetical protein
MTKSPAKAVKRKNVGARLSGRSGSGLTIQHFALRSHRGERLPAEVRCHGTTYLLFESVEFLEKLAALTPRPEINLVLYHGVLAPRARWRPEVVAYRRTECEGSPRGGRRRTQAPLRYGTRALLMRRAFDLDVLRCPRCAGRM